MSKERELLRRALEHLEWCDEECCNEKLEEQIRAFLADEPEAEPKAWMHVYRTHEEPNLFPLLTHECEAKGLTQYPLYTRHSPARKPMTEEELRKAFLSTNTAEPLCEGWPGLERFARAIEKHHGIGVDENG
jgi:hypothetical protein